MLRAAPVVEGSCDPTGGKEMRVRVMLAGFAVLVVIGLASLACNGDDDVEDGTKATGGTTPTATAEAAEDSRACSLLALADVESVTGDVISIQEGIPDEFESCFAFAGGGEVILEVCECLTNEEFDQEVVDAARGRGTVSETVLMVGDKASWVPAGASDPNTGILWVKNGETTLTLWLDVPIYRDLAAARADTVTLMGQVLAGLP